MLALKLFDCEIAKKTLDCDVKDTGKLTVPDPLMVLIPHCYHEAIIKLNEL